jgi:hypothetical protein
MAIVSSDDHSPVLMRPSKSDVTVPAWPVASSATHGIAVAQDSSLKISQTTSLVPPHVKRIDPIITEQVPAVGSQVERVGHVQLGDFPLQPTSLGLQNGSTGSDAVVRTICSVE